MSKLKIVLALLIIGSLVLISSPSLATQRLIVANFGDATSLDPQRVSDTASFWIMNQVYEGLVRRTVDMGVEPALAHSWEFIDDRTIEFYLRDDVYWHNGEHFTAHDVLYSYQRLLDPDFGSPGRSRLQMIDIENVELVDDYTIRIPTYEPFSALLTYLAHSASLLVNQKAIEQYGDRSGENPVGTGPFQFVEWRPGDYVLLEKYDDYWRGPAQVEELQFRVIPEATSRTIELETGGVHVSRSIQRVDLDRVEANPNLELHLYEVLRINYMYFNCQRPPFDDVRVRQAVSYVLDQTEITAAVYGPLASPARGFLNSSIWAFNPEVYMYPRDIEKAKALLEEAGYGDGFTASITINDDDARRMISEMVGFQLGQLGIQTSIEVYEWGAYLDRTAAGTDTQIMLGSWLASTGDPHHAMMPLFHSGNHGGAGNRSFYTNHEVDELLDKGVVETDMEQRMAYYQKAQELISLDAPWFPISDDVESVGVQKSVINFVPCPSGYHIFHLVGLDN